jgi:hypothetical protein
MWKCVSPAAIVLSHVRVDPHRLQKPRRVPGEEWNLVIAPRTMVTSATSKLANAAAGAPQWRRQLWQ